MKRLNSFLTRSIIIPPSLVRLALMNSALWLPHLSALDQGAGLAQVDAAFAFLLRAVDYELAIETSETKTHVPALSLLDRLDRVRRRQVVIYSIGDS
ncbi:unnamed protein product [Protopolystoma xenopodis]|uniref:Uncharacterized protein n=1 Tax=Protopolystoma xenopodis TaxID=117903 RepID=A0A3S5BT58_9PLAT|nr:unnamed protein product [Protopolystoma xenopodis]